MLDFPPVYVLTWLLIASGATKRKEGQKHAHHAITLTQLSALITDVLKMIPSTNSFKVICYQARQLKYL